MTTGLEYGSVAEQLLAVVAVALELGAGTVLRRTPPVLCRHVQMLFPTATAFSPEKAGWDYSSRLRYHLDHFLMDRYEAADRLDTPGCCIRLMGSHVHRRRSHGTRQIKTGAGLALGSLGHSHRVEFRRDQRLPVHKP